MFWSLAIDAQKDPVPILLIVAALGVVLWLLIGQSNRRDARRAARDRSRRGPT